MPFIIDNMISVVVPTYNRARLLEMCLSSLITQTYKDYEIIVVNDGSTDETEDIIKKFQRKFKNLRYFKQKNRGHSIARNLGFSRARGEIIASTDDDCIVENQWLEKIRENFRRYPKAAAVGGSIINPVNTRISWSHYILTYSSWSPRAKKRFVRDIPTCNIAYKKDIIKDLKFEDDKKSLGYRDTLFNFEVSKRGKILFDPDIKVYHYRWLYNNSIEELIKSQERFWKGFQHGGYVVHGFSGKVVKNLGRAGHCLRLLPIFYRCVRYGMMLKFIENCGIILRNG